MKELTKNPYTKRKKVCGVGINDVQERVVLTEKVEGKTVRLWTCPYYAVWRDMLKRCYETQSNKTTSYKDVVVCDEWLTFSSFKEWMSSQEWRGRYLDKDVLSHTKGFKIYSPETCAFVSRRLNNYFIQRGADRGNYPVGVSLHKKTGKYKAGCSVEGRALKLGYHSTPEQAHKAWQEAKLAYGRELLSEQTDERVIEGLTKILDNLADDIHDGRITERLV